MILHFSQPYSAPVSPLVLLFGGDVIPPEDTSEAVYSLMCNMEWQSRTSLLTKKLVVHWSAHNVLTQVCDLAWSSVLVGAMFDLTYNNTLDVITNSTALAYSQTDVVQTHVELHYSATELITTNTDLTWQTTVELFITETTLTYGNTELLQTSVSVHWSYNELVQQMFNFNWVGDAPIVATEFKLSYGFEPFNIVCHFVQHPKDGLVILNFLEELPTEIAPLSLSFNDQGKVCELVRSEWVLRAHDDLPVINSKIPIQPQLRSTYIVQPTFSCFRVSDDLEILITKVSYNRSRSQYLDSATLTFSSRIDYNRAKNELLRLKINFA